MSKRPQRFPRVDYSVYNDVGEKTSPEQPSSSEVEDVITTQLHNLTLAEMSKPSELEMDTKVIISEIQDIIDENPVHHDFVCNFDSVTTNLATLRLSLKKNQQLILAGNPDHPLNPTINQTLNSIKLYKQSMIECKSKTQITKLGDQNAVFMQRSLRFAVEDLTFKIVELQKEFDKPIHDISDAELLQMKSDLPMHVEQVNKIAKKYESILQQPIQKSELLQDITEIGQRYEHLLKSKSIYQSSINDAIVNQDVYKHKLFNQSKLNIRLEKFSGHQDSTDFYTFKSNFLKLHERGTPKHLLPDLLINNYLKDPALSLVKTIKDIDSIWERLKFSYGDVRMMLTKKLNQISSMDSLSSIRDQEAISLSLSKLITTLKETITLAEQHNIEQNLYFSDGLMRIYNLLDESRLTRWLRIIADEDNPKQQWTRLVTFLEAEQKLQQQKINILEASKPQKPSAKNPPKKDLRPKGGHHTGPFGTPKCYICDDLDGQSGHLATNGPSNTKIIQYHSCFKFAELSPANRLAILKTKGYCVQCLYPGANINTGNHKEGKCQRTFVCPHPSHQSTIRKHVLVCEEHKDSNTNKDLLTKYKERYMKNPKLPTFAKNISLSFHTSTPKTNKSPDDEGIYLLQTVIINNKPFTIFFDNGCSDFLIKHSAIKDLGSAAIKESSITTQIGGVGNTTTCTSLGSYIVKIPMANGQDAMLSDGTCLEQLTATFPKYPLHEVNQTIRQNYPGNPSTLPKPSANVGGDVHFMIGVKYLRYSPKLVFQMPSGLSIYKSVFRNADGGQGIIGGPHPIFTAIHKQFFNQSTFSSFCSQQYKLYKSGIQVNPDLSKLSFPSQNLKHFETAESTGTEITYRCVTCRNCKDCKNSIHQREVSIKEEVEQDIINSSIDVDTQQKTITARLPFIDQVSKLAPNKDIALKIYYQQLKKLASNPKDKEDIITSESKLQQSGYVDFVENLPVNQQLMLANAPTQNFIPWRAVWKTSSLSTPCRVVYDASHPTSSGYSLNDLLAKGQNNLNKLQEILIRWSRHPIGIHTDIRKMYNTIRLNHEDWCYQRYIWQQDLDPSKIPKEKVIKTLIYGVRSSGNQAECGLRAIADMFQDQYPEVKRIISEDVYVDDCITGEKDTDTSFIRSDELEVVTNHGGFNLKGVTISGIDPSPDLTDDGVSISVGGMKWYPKEDQLSLSISDLNFAKKQRGKKPTNASNIIPTNLTRRHCASKVAEVFDITGMMTPIIASMKLDLHELSTRRLDWDDIIPTELRPIWLKHFETMTQLGEIRFRRAVIPEDAISTDIQTLDFGDASQSLVCVCIYARYARRNGQFSSQLVFARSRTVPKGLSLPRAELMASLINTHTGEVVRRSFGQYHKSAIKFTDSQIALHWITNDEKPLKLWARNRVIDINRFSNRDQWFYINTTDMMADIGTRRGATLEDVQPDSPWFNGHQWMHLPVSDFPTQSAQDLRLSASETTEVEKERMVPLKYVSTHHTMNLVQERYKFSQYLIDPNRHRFSTVIRILAYARRYLKTLINRVREKSSSKPSTQQLRSIKMDISSVPMLTNAEVEEAEKYFFKKSSLELQKFLPKSKYERITKDVEGILTYTGRILPDQEVSIVGRFTEVMKDLSFDTFCVPVVDRYSPVAYSIALEIHWHHPDVQHSGIETTLRYTLKKCHIIEGRALMKQIKKACQRCRFLEKRTVEMSMGPISRCNTTIAPAFYHAQLDLSGPYQSYSPHHKRTTVKIWLIVFCCCSTTATKIYVMDDYSTTSFIQSITRFSSNHGFPNQLLCDEGSQLVKGCKEMSIDISDVQQRIQRNTKVNFSVCPVQGHNMHGKVERKIKEINLSISKSLNNQRLSILQWETLGASIANQINNLPIAIGDVIGDFEILDLITPNRLLLGRNNDRSIDGLIMCESPTKIIKENQKCFDAWFETWLLVHVPKLMQQQKWFRNDSLSEGDIVIFTKVDSVIQDRYTYGMISKLEYGNDLLPRRAKVRYRNANESVCRETYRSVRGLVKISGIDECDLISELGALAKDIDLKSSLTK